MNTTSEIRKQEADRRRTRLAELIRLHFNDTQAEFVAKVDGNQGEISALIGTDKSFGSVKARGLEEKAGLIKGSLDGKDGEPFYANHKHGAPDSDRPINAPNANVIGKMHQESGNMIGNNDISPRLEIHGRLPLISWNQARTWDTLVNTFAQEDAEDWLDCPVPHSIKSYCVQNVSDGMDDGTAEGYREGEILFVDPDVTAKPGDDVIVNTPDDKTIFRRLKEDTEGLYLLGMNGKKIMRIPEGAIICGVVIFSGMRRRRS